MEKSKKCENNFFFLLFLLLKNERSRFVQKRTMIVMAFSCFSCVERNVNKIFDFFLLFLNFKKLNDRNVSLEKRINCASDIALFEKYGKIEETCEIFYFSFQLFLILN